MTSACPALAAAAFPVAKLICVPPLVLLPGARRAPIEISSPARGADGALLALPEL